MQAIDYWFRWIILAGYAITIISCVAVVLKENRNPIRSIAWVIALVFLPIVGLVFYLFFGRSLRGEHMISRMNKRRIISHMAPVHVDISTREITPTAKNLIKLGRTINSSFYTENNEIEIFTTGEGKFESLKRDLRNAKESIYLQYYIFADDNIGREISEILIAKSKEGLDVKVIYDHVGSFSSKRKFFREMQEQGVEVRPFFRVNFPQLANRINWRNHRKLVVIDGKIGYVGGMNIADRYVYGGDEVHAWRDTHFRLCGDVVESMMFSFVVDWNFKNSSTLMEYPKIEDHPIRNNTGMQLINSGPTDSWDSLALFFLKAISGATRTIYIQTPYFLPTDALQHALEAAALSKIDVRIMIPARNDSKMLQYASFSYITQCLKAGIKVYMYTPGMLHAKSIIIDEEIVMVGSTNFDYRSFENNFECSLVVYDKGFNRRMRDVFFADLAKCTKISFPQWRHRPLLQRFGESILRLISPIL